MEEKNGVCIFRSIFYYLWELWHYYAVVWNYSGRRHNCRSNSANDDLASTHRSVLLHTSPLCLFQKKYRHCNNNNCRYLVCKRPYMWYSSPGHLSPYFSANFVHCNVSKQRCNDKISLRQLKNPLISYYYKLMRGLFRYFTFQKQSILQHQD